MIHAIPQRLSEEELRASRAATLTHWNGHDPIWLFGYGSLIWRPELDYDERVCARVFGFHRRLCLRSVLNRGTPDCPGLVAGLDRGGSCFGVIYRLPAATVHTQLEQLWEREMFMGSYEARWLPCHRLDRNSARVSALAFVVRQDAPNYCGALSEHELVDILARACGRYGTSLEYLQRTVESLRALGLRDPHLERLARKAGSRIADRESRPNDDT
jgi:cation transport protein ChaC